MAYISESLRNLVSARANYHCEYCLIPQASKLFSFEVDHIIAEKHRGTTDENNLCLSCIDCNRHKGSDFASFDPNTEAVAMLFNPRRDRWAEHFQLDGPIIQPLTPQGRVTAYLLHMNDEERVYERTMLIEIGIYLPADSHIE